MNEKCFPFFSLQRRIPFGMLETFSQKGKASSIDSATDSGVFPRRGVQPIRDRPRRPLAPRAPITDAPSRKIKKKTTKQRPENFSTPETDDESNGSTHPTQKKKRKKKPKANRRRVVAGGRANERPGNRADPCRDMSRWNAGKQRYPIR